MENIDIVKRTFEFSVRIFKLCQKLEEIPGIPRVLANQLFRSGTSIGANMEEAQAGESKNDFIHKCKIALKESRETNYWFKLLLAADILPDKQLMPLIDEAEQITRIIAKIVINTQKGM